MKLSALAFSASMFGMAACAKEGAAPPPGPEVAFSVAPLTLPDVKGVQYALAVFNAAPTLPMFDADGHVVSAPNLGNLVWQNPDVTSEKYGNKAGGGIAYVGTCDASVPENWAALVLRQIDVGDTLGSYDGAAPMAGNDNVLDDENSAFSFTPGSNDGDPDFDNPCDFAAPCVVKYRCRENEDTQVVFDFTIIRDAGQGFIDTLVDFDDIFCSMKVDTCIEGEPNYLLFNEDGSTAKTAVLASACSAGTDATDTVMWMSRVVVTCDGGVRFVIDPTGDTDRDPATPGEPGNHFTSASIGGTVVTPGQSASGNVVFSISPGDGLTAFTIPSNTVVTRINGLQYRTTQPATLDAATTSATVTATAIEAGAASNLGGSEVFLPIDYPVLAGTQVVAVTGTDFAGGVDAVTTGGRSALLHYMLTWRAEDLTCDATGTSCKKEFWTISVNLEDLERETFQNCRLTTAITASDAPALDQFDAGTLAGPGQTYGYVAIDAPLLAAGNATCFEGPMGSEYAPVRYGGSDDMLGTLPFPTMCHYLERGVGDPKSLANVAGYFADETVTPPTATYVGRLPAAAETALELAFDDMGGLASGVCGAQVRNLSEGRTFDGAAGLTEFKWKGAGTTGAYTISIFGKSTTGAWNLIGGYMVDLRTEDGRAFFTTATSFETDGYGEFAVILERTDLPVAIADDIRIDVWH